ncbi:MAG: PfkB family carbohydrate kinase [Rhodothermia bacterium]|nr:MAG: PfkB family carbohydrate kinase [Rhodothermia bacterium]
MPFWREALYLPPVLKSLTPLGIDMSVLAVGTVALDSVETPFGKAKNILGGSATYITLAARFFSSDVRLIAVIGYDFPEEFVDQLKDAKIDLTGLEVDRSSKTFAWEGKYEYDLNQRDTIATHLNALETFRPQIPERFRKSKIVCLGNLDPLIQCSVLDQMIDPDFVICDTMNFWINQTPDKLCETVGRIDCLVVNDSECRQLADEPNLIRAARIIQQMGPKILVIKKGEHGALLFNDESVFSVPAYPLEDIQDPTGAGDAFMGGFAGYLAAQKDFSSDALKQAVVFGSAVASFTVEAFGPDRLFEIDGPAISKRIEAFRELTTIPTLETVDS